MTYDSVALIQTDMARIKGDAAALSADDQPVAPASTPYGGDNSAGLFADALRNAVHAVDAKEHAAADKMAAVDSGRSDDLVGAMLSSQEASLSFSMLMQVRKKVMGAVDELIKLQV